MTEFKKRIQRVEKIMEQLQATYPQYKSDSVECFTGWYCNKSIGNYTSIIIATFVDDYLIILQNSIENKKVEIRKNSINFDFIYELTKEFKEKEKDL